MDTQEYGRSRDRRLRNLRKTQAEKLGRRTRKRQGTLALALLVIALCALIMGSLGAKGTVATACASQTCSSLYIWPVRGTQGQASAVLEGFRPPAQDWMPGHRGLDLSAGPGTPILSPADGTIAFAGVVGGKDVVSIRHQGGRTSTFEPARTSFRVGDKVSQGQVIGQVGGRSDHCRDYCLQWGVKIGKKAYLDPQSLVNPHMVTLKEMLEEDKGL